MGHSPGRLASGPWPGGEGEKHHHCPCLFSGQKEPCGWTPEANAENSGTCTARGLPPAPQSSGPGGRGGVGWAAVLPASLTLRTEPGLLFGWSGLLSAGFWTLLPIPTPVQSQVGSHPSTPTSDGDGSDELHVYQVISTLSTKMNYHKGLAF